MSCDCRALLADATDLSGASGWAGAGMLGMVLFWLLYRHIPQLTEGYLSNVKGLSDAFKDSLEKVVAHCEAETKSMAASWRSEVDRLVTAIQTAKREEAERIASAFESVHSKDSSKIGELVNSIIQSSSDAKEEVLAAMESLRRQKKPGT